MGLEFQDGFTPYFDHNKEIEVKNAAPKRPARPRRAKPAKSVPAAAARARRPELQGTTKPRAGSEQMK